MLDDNAGLIDLLTLISQETRPPLYKQRIDEIVRWPKTKMIEDTGGTASGHDADIKGEEAELCVCSVADISRLLSEDTTEFSLIYDIDDHGNWEERIF